MTVPRRFRRMVLDLTPIVDVIMILLFGVMLHSVARTDVDTREFRAGAKKAEEDAKLAREQSEFDRKAFIEAERNARLAAARIRQLEDQLAEASRLMKMSKQEREAYAEKLRQDQLRLAGSMAKLLSAGETQRKIIEESMKRVTGAGAARLGKLMENLQDESSPQNVMRALRRIEEMQKVFTFVDMHLGNDGRISVVADTRQLDRVVARDRSSAEIEVELRKSLEAVNFNGIVLLMFSYEPKSRRATVLNTEKAITQLIDYYRNVSTGQQKSFRFGRLGMVDHAPARLPDSN